MSVTKKIGQREFKLAVTTLPELVVVEYTAFAPLAYKETSGGYTAHQVVTKLEESLYLAHWKRWKVDCPDTKVVQSWRVVVTDPTAVAVPWSSFPARTRDEFKIAKIIRQKTNLVVTTRKWRIVPVSTLPIIGSVDTKTPQLNTKLSLVTFQVTDDIFVTSESGFDRGVPVERYVAYVTKYAFAALPAPLA